MTAYSTIVLSCDGDHCLRVHTCPLPPKTIDDARNDARYNNWTCDASGDFCSFKCSQQPTPPHPPCDGDGMLWGDSAGVVGVIGGRIAVADCPGCANCITATFAAIFARLEELEHGQEDHHARIAAMEAKPSTTGPPINEAGITATFAAIFAALDSLLDRVATLESARIAAPTAPESAETAGSATEAHSGCDRCPPTGLCYWCSCRKADELIDAAHADAAEVAAALRMYRKVQRLQACDDIFGFGVKMDTFLHFQYAAPLLAWLKEGEAQ